MDDDPELIITDEMRDEIIKRLSTQFTPEVIAEIRKIRAWHDEEWVKIKDSVYR